MKNEPKTVNGPNGWRATLKCANDELVRHVAERQRISAENHELRATVAAKNVQIQALDEFCAVLAQTIQDYQRGRA